MYTLAPRHIISYRYSGVNISLSASKITRIAWAGVGTKHHGMNTLPPKANFVAFKMLGI